MAQRIMPQQLPMFNENQRPQWEAVVKRDAARDGEFVFAVSTTGVYCRPSCPSRRPRPEHVAFFENPAQAERAGYRPCRRCRPRESGRSELVGQMCRFIEQHCDEPVTLERLAREFGMSSFHLQRVFKAGVGISPRQYADACRLRALKQRLQSGDSVTEAIYAAGFGSSSRVYERSNGHLGMTPATYQRGGKGVLIGYSTVETPVGRMLVAATDRGVCSVILGESEGQLVQKLRQEFPEADLRRRDVVLRRWVGALLGQMYGEQTELPLDIRATAFQRRVWEHLRSIPYGKTESYGQVARAIGRPRAFRAVAQACARNPVPIVIPCHRVVGSQDLGGYGYGVRRKRRLLEIESGRRQSKA